MYCEFIERKLRWQRISGGKRTILETFSLQFDMVHPVLRFAQKSADGLGYEKDGLWASNPGDRIRGSTLILIIVPVLHTGQWQWLTPVSLSRRCSLVSGPSIRRSRSLISGFSSGTNCSCWLRFREWLHMPYLVREIEVFLFRQHSIGFSLRNREALERF